MRRKSFKLIAPLIALYTVRVYATTSSLSYLQKENLGKTLNGGARNWFALTITSKTDNRSFNHSFDLQARMSNKDASYQVALPQAYFSMTGEYGELAIGRKFVDWSAGDSEWGLGNTNAHEGIDFIDFKKEGLFGIHYSSKRDGFNVDLLASFFHLPQVNPGLNHNKSTGEIEAKSEWTRVPPKSVLIEGTEVPLYYQVEMPNLGELLLKHSFGINGSYRWDKGAFSLYGLYKPESNVRVLANSQYEQFGTEQVRVNVSPFVNHTWVYGTKINQSFGAFDAVAGVDVIAPERKNAGSSFDVGSTRFAPKYIKRTYFHSSLRYTHSYFYTQLSYIKLIKGVGGADDYFSNDTMWHNALALKWKYMFSDSFGYRGSFRVDFEKSDKLLTSEVNYSMTSYLDLAMGVELIAANNQTSYWYPYRMNDTLYTSLTYIF
jgi:hypothetical protein